jgi:hypothetical protein
LEHLQEEAMADRLRFTELELEVSHRHGDHWAPMQREHNPANHDAERGWALGRIFRCAQCEDEIRVEVPGGTGRAEGPRG